MPTDHVYNLIILDESGSMQSVKASTISGFNELVQTIKGIEKQFPEQKHYISLITFNGLGIKTKLDRNPVSLLSAINEKTYNPDSMTPLYDAIALSVLKLKMDTAGIENANFLVTVLTDGAENASKEFSGPQVKNIIDEQKALGWTFTYIGANHDVEAAASSISITNTLKFVASNAGLNEMFAKESESRILFSKKIRNKIDPRENYFFDDDKNADSSNSDQS